MIFKLGLRIVKVSLILSSLSFLPAHAADKIPIRIAYPLAEDDPVGVAVAKFSARVNELVGDSVQVRSFSRSVLGNESVALEATIAGSIDIDIVSNTVLSGVVPELAVLDVPYGFSGPEHAWRVLDGDIGKSLEPGFEARGLRLAGWAYAGSRCVMTRSKQVQSADDMKGMKLRVPNNATYANVAKSWGAIPTTVGWPETYLALSQGVVDAIETAPGPSFDQKHYEVAEYLIRTDHLMYFHIWVISEKSWKSWPEEVRAAVLTAAQEAAMYNRELRLNQEKEIYDMFSSKGTVVVVPDRSTFEEKLVKAKDDIGEELKPIFSRIQAVR